MDDHKANIDKLLEIHAAVNPEVHVTVEQLCKEFPIFVRGLAQTIVELQEISKKLDTIPVRLANNSALITGVASLLNMEGDRLSHLQDRVLKLELKELS